LHAFKDLKEKAAGCWKAIGIPACGPDEFQEILLRIWEERGENEKLSETIGYWGNNITTGSTVYLTKNRGTNGNLFTDWELHGSKTTGAGTSATPGQTFTMEWGLGQVLPLKKDFSRLLQVGVIGYDAWQVSNHGGLASPRIPANSLPFYSVHAIGFQTNLILPAKALNFCFKFEDEYRSLARPEGRTFVFGGSYTLRIPKPNP
jgi:hypothetical protein